jgi:hypothetical protein
MPAINLLTYFMGCPHRPTVYFPSKRLIITMFSLGPDKLIQHILFGTKMITVGVPMVVYR